MGPLFCVVVPIFILYSVSSYLCTFFAVLFSLLLGHYFVMYTFLFYTYHFLQNVSVHSYIYVSLVTHPPTTTVLWYHLWYLHPPLYMGWYLSFIGALFAIIVCSLAPEKLQSSAISCCIVLSRSSFQFYSYPEEYFQPLFNLNYLYPSLFIWPPCLFFSCLVWKLGWAYLRRCRMWVIKA